MQIVVTILDDRQEAQGRGRNSYAREGSNATVSSDQRLQACPLCHQKRATATKLRSVAVGQRPSSRWAGPEFCQCRLACAGRFGHRFKKFRLSHQLALPGRVNFPPPRFGWMPPIFDSETVINGAER